MNQSNKKNQYPLLGEPQQLFEGENVYVIHEKAQIGKMYSFKCPQCHSIFISKTTNDEVVRIKCPECDSKNINSFGLIYDNYIKIKYKCQ